MDQHTPKEKNSCASKLSLSLEKKKKKKEIVSSGKEFVMPQRDENKFARNGKSSYQLTSENPFLVRYWPRCLALPPKNFPSSLIQVRHKGTPNSP